MTTPSTRHSWWVATLAGMVSYLDAGAIVTTGTALVIYREAFGFDDLQFGTLSALLTISIAVGALVGGPAGDRFGRKPVFLATLSLFAVGALVLTFATGTYMLFPGVVLLGFAAGADLPVSLSMVAEAATDANRGKLISFSHILWMAGVIVVSLLGTLFGDLGVLGARILYGHLLVVSLVVLVLRMGLPESQAWRNSRAIAVVRPGEARGLRGLAELRRPRYLAAIVATGLFYALVNIAANTNGQFSSLLYVEVAGAKVSQASLISMIITFVSAGSLLLMMRIVDGRTRMKWFTVMAALSIVAFLIPGIGGVTIATLAIFGVLYSIAGAVAGEPMYKVWSQELFPTSIRATAQSITIAFTRLVAAAVAIFTPALISFGPSIIFYFMVATSVVAFAIGIFWIARMPRATDDDPALRGDRVEVR
ncbi:MFS transporter [Microbacterium sp. ZXX196]|uniref:MFS transporter n=1 Tax=Microbacterium sp. ZXX196 TaxID=2609291 RepID=UPI0012BA19F2|nr:MFS transporter [Microbacterium sp. ZXX196]MTE23244.1 MFS transporter [Microbacterium sp. ZXX196]